MNLYRITLTNPQAPRYDVTRGMVVAADTSDEARVLAWCNVHGDQNNEDFLDEELSAIEKIGVADAKFITTPTIILVDFNAG